MLKTRKPSADVKDLTKDKTLEMLRTRMPADQEGVKMDLDSFINLFQEVVAGIPLAQLGV